eukprot:TRINITY_DN1828_c0_g2_i1.p4 TRINITY_DN1828_c0_g2~~TRINITY_DN1828_c0_g2_i1.p4  ORF type:complete len:111 (+),score=24.68 TRINITY_DN1828_c0_g2_i1:1318-1650(+)
MFTHTTAYPIIPRAWCWPLLSIGARPKYTNLRLSHGVLYNTFTVPSTTSVRVHTCSPTTTVPTMISVFIGSRTVDTNYGYSTCDSQSLSEFQATAGTTYYVLVFSFDSQE